MFGFPHKGEAETEREAGAHGIAADGTATRDDAALADLKSRHGLSAGA